jgi:hypothetical protein
VRRRRVGEQHARATAVARAAGHRLGCAGEWRNVSRGRGGRARLAWLSGRGRRRPTLSTPCAAAEREGGRADRSLAG